MKQMEPQITRIQAAMDDLDQEALAELSHHKSILANRPAVQTETPNG